MAQVTQDLVDEWKRALGKKLTPAFTTNEFDQLCFAWEELQRLRVALTSEFQRGWLQGRDQERALWQLTADGQELEAEVYRQAELDEAAQRGKEIAASLRLE